MAQLMSKLGLFGDNDHEAHPNLPFDQLKPSIVVKEFMAGSTGNPIIEQAEAGDSIPR